MYAHFGPMSVHSAYLFSLTGLPAGAYRKTSCLNYAKLFKHLLFIYLFFFLLPMQPILKPICVWESRKNFVFRNM